MNWLALAIVSVAAVPSCVVLVQCFSALVLRRRTLPMTSEVGPIAVVLPAHNEAGIIGQTVNGLLSELRPCDRLIVVADNCVDATADMARAAGAKVLLRHHDQLRGKGFALRHAIESLKEDPPDVVVFLDADCSIQPGGVVQLASQADHTQRPIQSAYLMQPHGSASPANRISAFAVVLKNLVRPAGMQGLGLPCLLTGSGMAFPWEVLVSVDHPGGNIVEDMAYSIDLALAGVSPKPEMSVRVHSVLPEEREAAQSQRTRWEHGHLDTILRQGPRLLLGFLRTGRPSLLAMLLDLSVPPLSLFVIAAIGLAALSIGWGVVTTFWWPAAIAVGSLIALATALSASWAAHGRHVLSVTQTLTIPGYMLAKIPMYFRFLWKPQTEWVRTSRDTAMQQELQLSPHFREGSDGVKKRPAHTSAKQ